MLNLMKLTHLTTALLITAVCINAQNAFDNALVFNTGNQTATAAHSTEKSPANISVNNSETSIVEIVSAYTAVEDITLKNYFNLAGNRIQPYMRIANASNSFNPENIAANTVKIAFNNRTIEYVLNGELYTFEISNIDHYLNNTPNCLIKAKIDVQCKPIKVNKEKISEVAVYVDSSNHISFIEIGNTEYYLRP
ncbi:MAG: hypothetical protein ACK4IY_08925 [Chitinophagales bacterium]